MLITASKPTINLPPVDVYRWKGLGSQPELIVSSIKGVVKGGDTVATQTYNAAIEVVRYYKQVYNRNSYDNKGATVNIIVGYEEAPGLPLNNAFWDTTTKTMYFGDGDGKLFSPLGTSRDVIAHEFAHAIISSEVDLDYSGQSGGIHESVSDILATGVDNNFKIGEDVFTPDIPGDGLRDLENLRWKTVDSIKGTEYWGEPHAMGEPLSHAAMLAAKTLGIDKVRTIWYTAISDRLGDHSGYNGFKQATLGAALALYGADAKQSMLNAYKAAGIK